MSVTLRRVVGWLALLLLASPLVGLAGAATKAGVVFDGMLLADYHQIYLVDAAAKPELPTQWTKEALQARVLAGDGSLTFMTARNMKVPVRVELVQREPSIALGHTDHVVVGNLRTSGTVVIAGLLDYYPDATRFSVPPGNLRVMVVSAGLGTLSADGLAGKDRYDVYLWPAAAAPLQVLRQWPQP